MAKFEVGDRVASIVDAPDKNNRIHVGDLGTVLCYDPYVNVRWDNYVDGHDCGGRCEYGYGWNMDERELEPYEEETEIDISDTSFMKMIGGV